jgi:glycosyl transferase family 1
MTGPLGAALSAVDSSPKLSKKITLVSGLRIYPCNTGGHVRTGGIAAALARLGHEVTIYSLSGRQQDYSVNSLTGDSYRIEHIADRLVEETNLGLSFGLLQAITRRMSYPRLWQHGLMRHGLVPRRLKALLRESDIILCDTPWCPPIPGPWPSKPSFLISHNLEHRLLEQSGPRQRRFAARMRSIEMAAPRIYRDIFVCAEDDRDFFRSHDPSRALKLPFIGCAVDQAMYRVPAGTRERVRADLGLDEADTLLVFAASRFGPNLDAFARLEQFCRDEAAFLRSKRVYILALGSVSPAPLRQGALLATGFVPEIASYLAAADAGLNPVIRGSGANVKVFEYLAARLPVISTIFGVRGTPLKPEVDFLPLVPEQSRAAIERFLRERTRQQWRSHAESVWARHQSACDIDELVKQAVSQRAEFWS